MDARNQALTALHAKCFGHAVTARSMSRSSRLCCCSLLSPLAKTRCTASILQLLNGVFVSFFASPLRDIVMCNGSCVTASLRGLHASLNPARDGCVSALSITQSTCVYLPPPTYRCSPPTKLQDACKHVRR